MAYYSKFISGSLLILVSVIGFFLYNPLFLVLSIISVYYIIMGIRWSGERIIEDRMRLRDELIKFTKPKDGYRILDVGTGAGLLAIGFAKAINYGEVIGIDIWVKFAGGTSIENAKRNAKIEGVEDKVKFQVGDVTNIPYPDNYFDLVVSLFVIHILKDKEKAFKEIFRVLKSEGVFALIEPKREFWTCWLVNQRFIEEIERIGFKEVRIKPLQVTYPKKRSLYNLWQKEVKMFCFISFSSLSKIFVF
jgi:ubiquinone/menaquinone biosynthesis C-methylase UbiE